MKQIVSAVTSKGQVTIPREVRQRLGVGTPDKVVFVLDDDEVRLKSAELTLESLYGSIKPLPGRESVDFEDQIEEAMDDEADRIVHDLKRP